MKIDVAEDLVLLSSLRQASQMGTDIAQPGMFDGREKSRPCGERCSSDLAGIEDV